MQYSNNFLNAITFEISLDKRAYFRKVYNLLDIAGEMGGLSTALRYFSILVILVSQY